MSQSKNPLFLLDGARFKLSFNELECDECGHPIGRKCVPLDQYASELQGQWVALVPAENDRHLELMKMIEQRDELLAALKQLVEGRPEGWSADGWFFDWELSDAHAAIAKAEAA